MDKKVLLIGGVIILIVGTIAVINGNRPTDDTNIKSENEAQIYQCSDNIDNDQDGLIDEKDPGCHSDNDVNNSSSYDPEDNDESNKLTQEGTLRDFFSGKMGTDLVCESTYKVGEDNEIKTIMYISGKRVRLDYDMKNPVPGMAGETQKDLHMVSDGEYGYVWGDSTIGGIMQGFKVKIDEMDSEEVAPKETEIIDYEMPVTDCKPWTVDEKMFEIPEGIDFIDPANIEEMTPEDIIPLGDVSIECSLCNQLPADQIANCLSSLGCE